MVLLLIVVVVVVVMVVIHVAKTTVNSEFLVERSCNLSSSNRGTV